MLLGDTFLGRALVNWDSCNLVLQGSQLPTYNKETSLCLDGVCREEPGTIGKQRWGQKCMV